MHTVSQSGTKIRLSEESPLSILNRDFPGGLPSQECLLNGRSFYGVPYELLCDHLRLIANTLISIGSGDVFSYCFSMQKLVPIPAEWAIELNSPQ